MRKKPTTIVIPAPAGWQAFGLDECEGDGEDWHELWKEPVVAWCVTPTAPMTSRVAPLTVYGHLDAIILQDPNGRLTAEDGLRVFTDEQEAVDYLQDYADILDSRPQRRQKRKRTTGSSVIKFPGPSTGRRQSPPRSAGS